MNDASHCVCMTCIRRRGDELNGRPLEDVVMVLCPECGNKRCPHANDHDNACTRSNATGQKGSAYEDVP